MADEAVRVAQYSLAAASRGTALGFTLAHRSTALGFSIARKLSTPVASLIDQSLGATSHAADPSQAGGPVQSTLDAILSATEFLAQGGISLGEHIGRGAVGASKHTVSFVSDQAGLGSDGEALRALSAFWSLVQREWTETLETDPEGEGGLGRWSAVDVFKAAACWMALQGVTRGQGDVLRELTEISLVRHAHPSTEEGQEGDDDERASRVLFDVTASEEGVQGEQVISAHVSGLDDVSPELARENRSNPPIEEEHVTRANMKRLSKLALGSYGGMGAVFFGVKLPAPPTASPRASAFAREGSTTPVFSDTASVYTQARSNYSTSLASSSEDDLLADELAHVHHAAGTDEAAAPAESMSMGLWGLLSGAHDGAVLEALGGIAPEAEATDFKPMPWAPVTRRPPRFFVITDHPNKTVLVLLRGTFTLDDIATDLACDALAVTVDGRQHLVHGGMWEMATAMGGQHGAVAHVVGKKLLEHHNYSLCVTGHSLGAGVAALLSVMWADPSTCATRPGIGLPEGRKVRCYGFAPPCTMDKELGARCHNLIHAFVYSTDVICRFSLGHVKDVRCAAAWLCHSSKAHPDASPSAIIRRIYAYRRGALDHDLSGEKKVLEETWFESIRRTLEANMGYACLFPAGEIWWLVEPGDLGEPVEKGSTQRLFKVTGNVSNVFKQMLFTTRMLSSHLPHRYMQIIHDLV